MSQKKSNHPTDDEGILIKLRSKTETKSSRRQVWNVKLERRENDLVLWLRFDFIKHRMKSSARKRSQRVAFMNKSASHCDTMG